MPLSPHPVPWPPPPLCTRQGVRVAAIKTIAKLRREDEELDRYEYSADLAAALSDRTNAGDPSGYVRKAALQVMIPSLPPFEWLSLTTHLGVVTPPLRCRRSVSSTRTSSCASRRFRWSRWRRTWAKWRLRPPPLPPSLPVALPMAPPYRPPFNGAWSRTRGLRAPSRRPSPALPFSPRSAMQAALKDSEWEVRTQAVKVLGSLDSRNFRCHALSRLEAIARGRTGEASSAVRGAASEAILIQSQCHKQGVRPGPKWASEPSMPLDSRSMAVFLRSLWPRGFEEWGFLSVCLYAAACFWCPDAVIEAFACLTFWW